MGGRLRRMLGGKSLRAPARCVRELLDALVERGEPGLAGIFWEDPHAASPRTHRDLRVLVNGRSMLFLEGLDTVLDEGDTISVFLAGARGWPGG